MNKLPPTLNIVGINIVERPTYVINRHGETFYRYTKEAAMNMLAHIMTRHVFWSSGIEIREHGHIERRAEGEVWVRGPLTHRYRNAHERCLRRLWKPVMQETHYQRALYKKASAESRYLKRKQELDNATRALALAVHEVKRHLRTPSCQSK